MVLMIFTILAFTKSLHPYVKLGWIRMAPRTMKSGYNIWFLFISVYIFVICNAIHTNFCMLLTFLCTFLALVIYLRSIRSFILYIFLGTILWFYRWAGRILSIDALVFIWRWRVERFFLLNILGNVDLGQAKRIVCTIDYILLLLKRPWHV